MKQILLTAKGRPNLAISKEEYATLNANQFVHDLHWMPESAKEGNFKLSRQQKKNLVSLCLRLETDPTSHLLGTRSSDIAAWLRSARRVKLAVIE